MASGPLSPPRGDGPADDLQRTEKERDRAMDAQARFAFLAHSSRLLAESIDYEETLTTVAATALPHLGAWCTVDVLENGKLRRLAVIHPDPDKQATARELYECYPPESDDVFGVRRVMESGESDVVLEVPDAHLRHASRDGEHLRLLRKLGVGGYMTVPLRARGQVLGVVSFITAENGRVFGDSDLLLAEDLARRGAMAIDNARLYEQAQEANRAKTDFLAVISHELRTPIAGIIGYTDILESGVTGERVSDGQRLHLRRIRLASEHLVRLVDELLTYARVEDGRTHLHWESVRVGELVDGTLEIVREEVEELGLTVEVQVPEDLTLVSDRRNLHFAILNLLTNAIKFTEQGAVRVRACGESGTTVIEVEDSGVGIPPEQQKRVFEPFWQAERPITRAHGGIGIGLTLTERLVEVLGGEISLDSAPGRGSTFRIRLPERSPEGKLAGGN